MALLFDGNSNVVNHGDIANAEGANLTIAFRYFITAATLNDEFFHKFVSGSSGYRAGLINATTSMTFQIGTGGTNSNTSVTSSVVTGAWQHWVWVYDGSQGTNLTRSKVFLDGVPTTPAYNVTVPVTIAGNALAFLAGSATAGRAPTGRMADFMIWNASLTDAQAIQQFTLRRPVRTSNLLLWSPYDDGVSAKDYSGSGNHGTVTGATQAAGAPLSYGARVGMVV